jgi:hypothetical protein
MQQASHLLIDKKEIAKMPIIQYVSCTNLSLAGTQPNSFRDFPQFLHNNVMYSDVHIFKLLKPSGLFTYHQV